MKRTAAASADIARTRALMEHLIRAFEQFCNEGAETELPYIDAFMGVHNFHKAIVLDLLQRQELSGDAARLFLKMAQHTFSEAMKAEIRKRSDP